MGCHLLDTWNQFNIAGFPPQGSSSIYSRHCVEISPMFSCRGSLFQDRWFRPWRDFVDMCADVTPLGGPNAAWFRAWAAPESRRKVDA